MGCRHDRTPRKCPRAHNAGRGEQARLGSQAGASSWHCFVPWGIVLGSRVRVDVFTTGPNPHSGFGASCQPEHERRQIASAKHPTKRLFWRRGNHDQQIDSSHRLGFAASRRRGCIAGSRSRRRLKPESRVRPWLPPRGRRKQKEAAQPMALVEVTGTPVAAVAGIGGTSGTPGGWTGHGPGGVSTQFDGRGQTPAIGSGSTVWYPYPPPSNLQIPIVDYIHCCPK